MTNVAGLVVKQDGKYLLIQERRQDISGLWSIPGGHLEPGESPESAALREGKEETGYEFELVTKLGEFRLDAEGQEALVHIFKAKIIPGGRPLDKKIRVLRWFLPSEIQKLSLRHNVLRKFLR